MAAAPQRRRDPIAAVALAAALGLHGAVLVALLLIDRSQPGASAAPSGAIQISLVSPYALGPVASVGSVAAAPEVVPPARPPAEAVIDAGAQAAARPVPPPPVSPRKVVARTVEAITSPDQSLSASDDAHPALGPRPIEARALRAEPVTTVPAPAAASTEVAAAPDRIARQVPGEAAAPPPPAAQAVDAGPRGAIVAWNVEAASPAAADSIPGVTGRGAGRAGETETYLAAVRAWIDRHKQFPRHAERRGEEGTVLLRVVMARNGAVLSRAVARSSGYAALDREAAHTIDRAAPLPAAPEALAGGRMELLVPISFALGK